ncbi:MAG: beta-ketoacyl synthase chain length factor [Sedimenticolaceae bacterium]
MKVHVAGVGLVMPGVESWQQAKQVFSHPDGYDVSAPLPPIAKTNLLSANERRRTTRLIQMALHCGQDAVQGWQGKPATVFALSCGDLGTVDKILQALTLPGHPISSTQFHNSVHNASAGYWSILTGSNSPSTSISAWDASFSAGLLEAATQVMTDHQQVLLVACDYPPPARLTKKRQIKAPFSVALLLMREGPGPSLTIALNPSGKENKLTDLPLESLRLANPAARSLPLMQLLASREHGEVNLSYLNNQLLNILVRP